MKDCVGSRRSGRRCVRRARPWRWAVRRSPPARRRRRSSHRPAATSCDTRTQTRSTSAGRNRPRGFWFRRPFLRRPVVCAAAGLDSAAAAAGAIAGLESRRRSDADLPRLGISRALSPARHVHASLTRACQQRAKAECPRACRRDKKASGEEAFGGVSDALVGLVAGTGFELTTPPL